MAVIKKLCKVNITSLLTSHHSNIVCKRYNGLNTRQLSNFPSFSTNDSEGKCEYLILHLKASKQLIKLYKNLLQQFTCFRLYHQTELKSGSRYNSEGCCQPTRLIICCTKKTRTKSKRVDGRVLNGCAISYSNNRTNIQHE